ncbi:kinase-like domain-containing protein [Rhizophagus clarus]|uniref:Kinase-like domain-containing protein n=1 Tax=Rhizophagus clarus TaxID=94130 RepID=A0A8H3QHA5_9GLOM|nr:kinase-like domain-containing protein [Rhizophagus clarus]
MNGKLWCKECVPRFIIEGWTSGNNNIDEFIKGTIYNAGSLFLEWVSFDRFEDIKQIGEGGFAKVYSAKWIDGKSKYFRKKDGSWEKSESEPIIVALKKLNESQNISADYLNELKVHWSLYNLKDNTLKFYGLTKDPETKEFMMIIQLADQGNLRCVLSNFHSGNILHGTYTTYISDFGLSRPSNEQKSDNEYVDFGVIMTELSSGKPPFYKRKHDISLVLEICNGIRPDFGKGIPEIYKKLAYRCMNANPDQRPTASELHEIIYFWYNACDGDEEKFGYKGKEIKAIFEEADKEIPNISTSYEKNPDAIYTSRVFTFNNLPKPVNSSIITSYLNEEEENKDCQDSKLFDLEIPN